MSPGVPLKETTRDGIYWVIPSFPADAGRYSLESKGLGQNNGGLVETADGQLHADQRQYKIVHMDETGFEYWCFVFCPSTVPSYFNTRNSSIKHLGIWDMLGIQVRCVSVIM